MNMKNDLAFIDYHHLPLRQPAVWPKVTLPGETLQVLQYELSVLIVNALQKGEDNTASTGLHERVV